MRCLCLPLFTTVAASAGAGIFTHVTGDTRIRHEDRERDQHPHLRYKFEHRFRGRAVRSPSRVNTPRSAVRSSFRRHRERDPQHSLAGRRRHGSAVMCAEPA